MTLEPRPAGPDDAAAVLRVLVTAFMDDPVMRWFDPRPRARERRLARLFGHVLEKHLPRGTVWTNDDRSAAAVWVPPGTPVTAADVRFYLSLYANRLPKGLFWALFVESRRPRFPHWLLLYLGVAPERQGRGLGGALLQAGLERAAAEGRPAYLVASSPGSRRLYERCGFRVLGEVRLLRGPHVWPMLREAR
ncbi:GNAT family N-acetyltransferase [Oceanithermus sp.]|uniref:GNAT family N-acetyltransferase n=1 Tax=Oceanithermus sp. TaxID=2268145 RepID=UPI00257C3054|nr:GNAT family N-acetyltransferase [Oceanithermus sp.]